MVLEEIIEIEDIKRIEYSEEDGQSIFYILDWDDDKQNWTNSFRYSFGSHKWCSCHIDETAEGYLREALLPIAEKLGVNYGNGLSVRQLVELTHSVSYGSYREEVKRKPYPGEIERGESPSLNVEVFLKQDGTVILLREKPIF